MPHFNKDCCESNNTCNGLFVICVCAKELFRSLFRAPKKYEGSADERKVFDRFLIKAKTLERIRHNVVHNGTFSCAEKVPQKGVGDTSDVSPNPRSGPVNLRMCKLFVVEILHSYPL